MHILALSAWAPLLAIYPTLNDDAFPHFGKKWADVALDNTPALIPLCHFGLLELEGPDASAFLQGQLTINIEKITPDTLQLAGYCNPKGRLHSIFYLTAHPTQPNHFILLLPQENMAHLIKTLKKYALFSKITISDITHDWLPFYVTQPASFSELNTLSNSYFYSLDADHGCLLISPEACETHWETLVSHFTPKSPLSALHYDIEHHHPWIEESTIEQFLPHDIELPKLGAVDFTKGCYVGQEIVARMEYRGKLKKQLVSGICESDTAIPAGTALYPDGKVVNSVPLTDNTQQILAIAPLSTQPLHIHSADGPLLKI